MIRKEIFATQLTTLRESLGWSQTYLAKKSGLLLSAISHYESGNRRPQLDSLVWLAQAFDVSLDVLVFGVEVHRGEEGKEEKEAA